jgi:hypothetical protein
MRPVADSTDRHLTVVAEGRSVSCSFCGKAPANVGDLIEGPALPGGRPVYICRDCVELCSSILEHERIHGHPEEQDDESIQCESTRGMLTEKIAQKLSILTSIEEYVIRLRHGLTDGYSYTLNEVGEMMGLAPERVAQIEALAIAKLRAIGPEE